MNKPPQFFLTLEPIPGIDIADVCEHAVMFAANSNLGVRFTFNGVYLVAWPDTDPMRLADKYRKASYKDRC